MNRFRILGLTGALTAGLVTSVAAQDRGVVAAHVEARYPVTKTVSPFVFAGGGGVTVDQAGSGGLEGTRAASTGPSST
jgi:hypothetical protein